MVALFGSLQAQQEHQYTQFMYNKLLLNPAYAGARGVPSITGIYRNQWLGFDGAPQSFLASFNSPFLSPRVGVGITLSHLKIGLQRDFFGNLAYSYDLVAKENVSIRVGIQASIRSLSVAFDEAKANQPGDPSIDAQRINDFYGNVGAGLYATIAQQFYVGFSVPRIYSNVLGFNPIANKPTAREYRHYYATAGAILPLGNDLSLMPAVLVKYVENAPIDADINLNFDIKKKFTAGLSARIGGDNLLESMDLLVFWQVADQVGIGAAYDFTLSKIRDYTAGSIEVMVQADLKKPGKNGKNNKKKKMTNPRFFM